MSKCGCGTKVKLLGCEIDPCDYEEREKHINVTVSVRVCRKCGHIDIVWYRQPETVDINVSE